ncbi:8-amino-7-oxononanoate synthase [Carex rostrata]
MISLNSIQSCHSPPHRAKTGFSKGKRRLICTCSSRDESTDSASPVGGDRRKQEILAQIAMLQAQKVRVVDFIDDRTKDLTKFGEDYNEELEEIGKNVLSNLDETSGQIMERLDGRMQEFDEAAEIRWKEIEENEMMLKEFEKGIEKGRNEGLFFKSLKDKKSEIEPEAKMAAKAEAEKIKEISKEKAGSKFRRNIYRALMAILAIAIGDGIFAAPGGEVEWRKVAALGLILIGLVAQIIYEQDFSSNSQDNDK